MGSLNGDHTVNNNLSIVTGNWIAAGNLANDGIANSGTVLYAGKVTLASGALIFARANSAIFISDIAAAGTTDSDPFAAQQIPQITIHSLTQQNVTTGATTQFRPGNYYDTYRLLCGYLAYLDQTLKPRRSE